MGSTCIEGSNPSYSAKHKAPEQSGAFCRAAKSFRRSRKGSLKKRNLFFQTAFPFFTGRVCRPEATHAVCGVRRMLNLFGKQKAV